MVDRNIFDRLGLSQAELDQQVSEMFSDEESEFLEGTLKTKVDSYLPGVILQGKIVSQIGNDVIVEVGLKSEGIVDASEFDSSDEVEPGREIEVLLEDTDSEDGLILLSKRKADRIKGWETIINTKNEGDVVSGRVVRRIKGGLLVDIGVPVFLPASQVDIRKPGDISRFIGKEIESKILKIDVEGRNIVISRRKLIEEKRKSSKEKILSEIEAGQLRKGIVKNIADFGVFVDLGGLDGLLHISDLSWGRISHPSEVVELDQEIECFVIGVDKEKEKISLGLKQKTTSPWKDVEAGYPIGARAKGKVVNVMNYGVFVRLEDGIEGLVHISEMSWTRRLNHPSEILSLGDEVEVVVLSVNRDKQEISLGLKQTEINPWTVASQKYPPGTIVNTTVRSVINFGAFVEIDPGIDGMVHISDLSWTRKYSHPGKALQKDQEVKCVVLEVNEEKRRISLGIKQMTEDPWIRAIPEKYIPGHIIKGTVSKLTNFGAFVELEPDLEGLLHISELADHKIDNPQDVVKKDQEVEVKILKVDTEARKIGLSLRRAQWAAEEQQAETTQQQTSATAQPIPSDTDAEEVTEPQGKPAEPEPGEQTDEAAQTEAGDVEKTKVTDESKPRQADKAEQTQEGAEDESEAGEAAQTEAGDVEKTKVTDESKPRQADEAEQTQEGAEDESEAGEAAETESSDVEKTKETDKPKSRRADEAEQTQEGAEDESEAGEAAETESSDVEKTKETDKPKSRRAAEDEQVKEKAEAESQNSSDSNAEESAESDTDN